MAWRGSLPPWLYATEVTEISQILVPLFGMKHVTELRLQPTLTSSRHRETCQAPAIMSPAGHGLRTRDSAASRPTRCDLFR